MSVFVSICHKPVKVAHRLTRVRFRSWSQFLAVSLQVMWIINPVVGCHYFPPSLQLPQEPLRGLLPILLLWTGAKWVWTVCLRLLPNSISTAIWTQALLCIQHANHSATEPQASILSKWLDKSGWYLTWWLSSAYPVLCRKKNSSASKNPGNSFWNFVLNVGL